MARVEDTPWLDLQKKSFLVKSSALEGSCCLVECVEDENYCERINICATHEVWKEASLRLKTYFENLSLKDLIEIEEKKIKKAAASK